MPETSSCSQRSPKICDAWRKHAIRHPTNRSCWLLERKRSIQNTKKTNDNGASPKDSRHHHLSRRYRVEIRPIAAEFFNEIGQRLTVAVRNCRQQSGHSENPIDTLVPGLSIVPRKYTVIVYFGGSHACCEIREQPCRPIAERHREVSQTQIGRRNRNRPAWRAHALSERDDQKLPAGNEHG